MKVEVPEGLVKEYNKLDKLQPFDSWVVNLLYATLEEAKAIKAYQDAQKAQMVKKVVPSEPQEYS